MARVAVRLESLAFKRLDAWRKVFARKFPRISVSITFGMGSECVTIGGKQVNSWECDAWPRTLSPWPALEDVWTITNSYRLACPEDFSFGPGITKGVTK